MLLEKEQNAQVPEGRPARFAVKQHGGHCGVVGNVAGGSKEVLTHTQRVHGPTRS